MLIQNVYVFAGRGITDWVTLFRSIYSFRIWMSIFLGWGGGKGALTLFGVMYALNIILSVVFCLVTYTYRAGRVYYGIWSQDTLVCS